MARTDNLTNFLTDIANALREKTDITDPIQASEFDTIIRDLEVKSKSKIKILTANDSSSYFVLPILIQDIREFEIEFRFTQTPSGESWMCGNWKSNSNVFLIGYYSGKLQASASSTGLIQKTFDMNWHNVKIKNNKIIFDDVDESADITFNELQSNLGELNIFRSVHYGGSAYHSIKFVKIKDVNGNEYEFYPYLIDDQIVMKSNDITIQPSGNANFVYEL